MESTIITILSALLVGLTSIILTSVFKARSMHNIIHEAMEVHLLIAHKETVPDQIEKALVVHSTTCPANLDVARHGKMLEYLVKQTGQSPEVF